MFRPIRPVGDLLLLLKRWCCGSESEHKTVFRSVYLYFRREERKYHFTAEGVFIIEFGKRVTRHNSTRSVRRSTT